MKKKEVEDILGGKGAWDNVDKTEGMFEFAADAGFEKQEDRQGATYGEIWVL